MQVNIHFLRKENQLTPALEAHGVSGPSSFMWALHDDIRKALKDARSLVSESEIMESVTKLRGTPQAIAHMIYKGENILFPMVVEILPDPARIKVRKDEVEIGYAWIMPEASWTAQAAGDKVAKHEQKK